MTAQRILDPTDTFVHRHLGSDDARIDSMLETLGFDSVEDLVDAAVPAQIRSPRALDTGPQRGEHELLGELENLLSRNELRRSFIGMGYSGTITPGVILRNILENPGWYTQYTPYQAEIAQGRLEALLSFQTMVADLTGLPLANASLLDEATSAAEAMVMCFSIARRKRARFFAADDCHPQTLAVLATRAEPVGIELEVGPLDQLVPGSDLCGILVQYPNTLGEITDHRRLVETVHAAGGLVVMATDLLALTLLVPPGEVGADIALGSSQRFGVPMGQGGPHAAFLATREQWARQTPGRIVGVSKDAEGKPAYRLALQTREQHIRREKATSNICTAQVLLAIVAAMYAVYHGPHGLRRIGRRVHGAAAILAAGLRRLGFGLGDAPFFDTVTVPVTGERRAAIIAAADERGLNLRIDRPDSLSIAVDETTDRDDLKRLLESFADGSTEVTVAELEAAAEPSIPEAFARTSAYLTNDVFHRYHSEHEMLRYLYRLQSRDLSLTHSMIPLGSCTMKLNATSEMLPITWPVLADLHPYAPPDQVQGTTEMCRRLEMWLAEITGFAAISFQPNAGSQGEYTGLLVIRAHHHARGEVGRDVCLIPTSAHGTNPASAVMAGFRVVAVACDDRGNIDLDDLRAKAEKHSNALGALMITYPSTHGVYEESVKEVCALVHEHGGQVYLDGANLNALVGLARPGELGADVCHLNLHKTFCIPHGGGGPGMGPIGVAEHLVAHLPGHPMASSSNDQAIGAVAAAPLGSPLILPISWTYIGLMGSQGLLDATQLAILNANYMAKRLGEHYPILYTGANGLVAHEFIVDMRAFRKDGVTVDDVAKRLMDFGFHAPTISWPVAGTIMIEPTESESKEELDRFCDALIQIREEIREIESGAADPELNPLKMAPHTAAAVTADAWDRPYSRAQAAYPAPWLREHKFWPPVARIDNAFGDRNLACTCDAVEAYAE